MEISPIGGKNVTTGVSHSLSRQKNLPSVIASKKMHPCDFGSPPVTADTANRTIFRPKPGRHPKGQALNSNNVLSKESTRVDLNMKQETSSNKWSQEDTSRPVIAAVEGGFHTQYLLFSRNDAASASAAANSAFLLKIQSNCCWDRIRPRILEIVSKQCRDNTVYPPIERLHIDGFLVEILPKSDRPEILPPDVQKRMMSRTLHAICIRITVDRSAMNSPLRSSLATGLSAFTKLRLKFSSEKSFQNIKSSQSSVQRGESVEPKLSTSCSFDPFASKHAETALSPATVTQPTNETVTCADLECSHSQTGISTDSVCPKQATSSSFSLTGNSSTKIKLTATGADDSRLLAGNKTEPAGQPVSTSATKPSRTSLSSSPSSFLCADSHSQEKLMLPVRKPKSVKLAKHDVHSAAGGSRQPLNAALGSLSDIRQNLHKVKARSPAEVIVVEEDDCLPPNTSSCQLRETDAGAAVSLVHSSSVQSSTALSQCLVSHSSTSDTVQSVDMHISSISVEQPVSDVPVLSHAAVCPVSFAGIDDNSRLSVPVMSVGSPSLNIASSQSALTEQPDLMETTAVISSPAYDSAVVEAEQITDGQQSEIVECSGNTTEPSLAGFCFAKDDSIAEHSGDTETAALHTPQPLISVNSLGCCEELSDDAGASSMVEEKLGGTCQQSDDMDCQTVASSSAEQVVSGAEALLSVDVHSAEQSAINISGHQKPRPAAVLDASASLQDNTVEIVSSDEVRSFCGQNQLFYRHNFLHAISLSYSSNHKTYKIKY